MADDKVTIQITGESAELQAAAKKAADALDQLRTKVGQTSGDLVKMDAATRSLAEKWDPAAKALRQGEEAAAGVSAALKEGTLSAEQATRVLDGVASNAKKAGAAHAEMHGSVATATREFRALFDELSSGRTRQTPGTLAIIANRVFGLQGASLAAAGGVAALGLAFVETLRHADAMAQGLRNVESAMRAIGAGGAFIPPVIEGTIAHLRSLPGISTEVATQMEAILSRVPSGPVLQQSGPVAQSLAGVGKAFGAEPTKLAEEFAKAVEGGTESMARFAQTYKILDGAGIAALFKNQNDQITQQTILLNGLTGKYQNFVEQESSGWAKAWSGIGAKATDAWDGMVHLLSGNPGAASLDSVNKLKASLAELDTRIANAKANPGVFGGVALPTMERQRQLIQGQIQDQEALIAIDQRRRGTAGDAAQKQAEEGRLVVEAYGAAGAALAQRAKLEADIARIKEISKNATGEELKALQALRQEDEDRLENLRDRGGQAKMKSWQDQLNGQLDSANGGKGVYGQQAVTAELKFWEEKKAAAEAGGAEYQSALKQIDQKIRQLKNQEFHGDASAARQAGSEEIAAAREKVGEIMATEGQGRLAQLASARDAWGQLLTSQKLSAQQRLEVEKEYQASIAALNRAGDAEKGQLARGLAANQREIDTANLAADREAVQASFQAHEISAAQKADVETSYARVGAGLKIELLNDELAALKEAGQAETAEYQITADKVRIILAQLNLDLAKIDKQRTEDEKAELAQRTAAWKEAEQGILSGEDALASALVNKNESLGKAMKKMFADMATHELGSDLKSGTASIFDSLLGTDLSKGNQGGILVSLFKGLGGAGGAAKGAIGLAGDATKDAAVTANTAALTALTAALTGHGAVVATNTVATGANSGAALAGAGASAANTATTATNTATQASGILAWIGNTAATIWNTIATEGADIAGLIGFDVGSPSVPFDMPAMVHKGEIIVPAGLSSEIRAGRAAIGGAGGGTWSAPRIGMPAIGGVSAASGNTHFHIDASHTVNGGLNAGGGDLRSMAKEIANNHLDTIIGGLQKAHRNGRLMPGINRR